MCDKNNIDWMKRALGHLGFMDGKTVLEVGCRNINGSLKDIIKAHFPIYVGCDIEAGEEVDIVLDATKLVDFYGDRAFDMVVTANTFEHIEDWRLAISNIKRVVAEDGYIIFIVPSVWEYHEYPGDYWRYSVNDVQNIFADCRIESIEEMGDNPNQVGVYAIIRKPVGFKEIDLSNYNLGEPVQP